MAAATVIWNKMLNKWNILRNIEDDGLINISTQKHLIVYEEMFD